MDFPDFFADAPTITLHDPLAVFLGVSKNGVLTYVYADAVKLAGHSCPTIAGAYLMVRRGLRHLYGDEMPERGGVEVYLRDPRDQGTTGVIAAVATLLTVPRPKPDSAVLARSTVLRAVTFCISTRQSTVLWLCGGVTMHAGRSSISIRPSPRQRAKCRYCFPGS